MLVRELFENDNKTAVVAFGRMNPPTIGHKKLVEKVQSLPGDPFLFLSQTHKLPDNPLAFETKLAFAEQFFPGVTVGDPEVRTPIQMLQKLEELGYKKVIYVAGSDRVEAFEQMFNAYNGQPDKKGVIPYTFESITVVSAGERDPDADGAEGASASKMREAALNENFDDFVDGVPEIMFSEALYEAVRSGMGLTELTIDQLKDKVKQIAINRASYDKIVQMAMQDGISVAAQTYNLSNRFVQNLVKKYEKRMGNG
jgi:hypothetical protein